MSSILASTPASYRPSISFRLAFSSHTRRRERMGSIEKLPGGSVKKSFDLLKFMKKWDNCIKIIWVSWNGVSIDPNDINIANKLLCKTNVNPKIDAVHYYLYWNCAILGFQRAKKSKFWGRIHVAFVSPFSFVRTFL